MIDTREKIAAGLEDAFAANGFAEPSVEILRRAAGVSLRTLYKYAPSRDEMVRIALEHRHCRYIAQVFSDLPDDPDDALEEILDRVAGWMAKEASHGCLFHAAVAAAPSDAALRSLLKRHKAEVAERTTHAADLPGHGTDLMLLIEGLIQSWPVAGAAAIESAKRLARLLR